jgi:hypothetical protein
MFNNAFTHEVKPMKKVHAGFCIGSLLVMFSATAAAATECPATFEEFMKNFEGSTAYQLEHTKFPLVYRQAEGNQTTAPVDGTIADAAAYQAIQYPSPAQQQAQSLERKDSSDRGGATSVRLEKPGSGTALQYRFIKTEECWQLVRMEKGAVTTQIAPSVNVN